MASALARSLVVNTVPVLAVEHRDDIGGFLVCHGTSVSTLTLVSPSAANNTIRARQTTFCGVFRSRTNRSNHPRSASLTEIRSIFLIPADSQVCVDL